jgi:hypothetical protein
MCCQRQGFAEVLVVGDGVIVAVEVDVVVAVGVGVPELRSVAVLLEQPTAVESIATSATIHFIRNDPSKLVRRVDR